MSVCPEVEIDTKIFPTFVLKLKRDDRIFPVLCLQPPNNRVTCYLTGDTAAQTYFDVVTVSNNNGVNTCQLRVRVPLVYDSNRPASYNVSMISISHRTITTDRVINSDLISSSWIACFFSDCSTSGLLALI